MADLCDTKVGKTAAHNRLVRVVDAATTPPHD
jgi:hypothetical protein